MTFRVKLYLAIVAVLAVALFGIYERHSGLVVGTQQTLIAHDDSLNKVNARKTSLDSIKAKAQSDSLRVVLMERDSLAQLVQKAQRQKDTALSLVSTERREFVLKGDTAEINGQKYVLPVTISTYVRLSDTAFKKQGDLDAIEAEADSNASRTIARLESLHTADTTLITDQRVTITQQAGEIKDLKAAKAPRFGFKSGLVAGLAIVAAFVHFVQ